MMKNEWIAIEVGVPGAWVDLVSVLLADCGCSGVVVEERQLDTFVVPDDALDAERIYRLKGYFEADCSPEQLVTKVAVALRQAPLPDELSLEVLLGETVQIEDWSEQWKQNFSAFRVGERLVVCPSWEEAQVAANDVVIEIDPGMAFGTGSHATTRLCLEAIAELLASPTPPAQMLDVGTGSGLLALGAAALGCAVVLANDIDPIACQVARENVQKNGYQERIEVTETPLESLSGSFDLVVANILAEENVRLGPAFMAHLRPGGWLVLSGILREKEVLVRTGFDGFPLESFASRYLDDWVCLLYRRNR